MALSAVILLQIAMVSPGSCHEKSIPVNLNPSPKSVSPSRKTDVFIGLISWESLCLFVQKLLLDLFLTADNITLLTQNAFLVQIVSFKQDTSSKLSSCRSIDVSILMDALR